MPHDLALKGMNLAHRAIHVVSFGRLGWSAMGMPVLELTTRGRRTGQSRSLLLTSPLELDGGRHVIVASRGGDDRQPAWFLNLQADPEVGVAFGGGERRTMHARVTEGDERADLWARLTAAHRNYAEYQTKTDREIPVVVLEPVD